MFWSSCKSSTQTTPDCHTLGGGGGWLIRIFFLVLGTILPPLSCNHVHVTLVVSFTYVTVWHFSRRLFFICVTLRKTVGTCSLALFCWKRGLGLKTNTINLKTYVTCADTWLLCDGPATSLKCLLGASVVPWQWVVGLNIPPQSPTATSVARLSTTWVALSISLAAALRKTVQPS